jgi:cytochrome b pre-mRNA-processing protein 3
MILLPYRRRARNTILADLYGTIVAQARSPTFYLGYGVPDTVAGRLDMIVLHLVLFLARLKDEPAAVRSLGQGVFDQFCADMDSNLREMGVGDLAVPKEMRKVGETFYGRAAAYEQALAADDAALVDALARIIFGKSSAGATRLAAYIREAVRMLAAQMEFSAGALRFPAPDSIAPVPLGEGMQP